MPEQQPIRLRNKERNINLIVGAEFLIFGTENEIPTLRFYNCARIESFAKSPEEIFHRIAACLEGKRTCYTKVSRNCRWADYKEYKGEGFPETASFDYVFEKEEKVVAFWDSKTCYLYFNEIR